MSDDTTTPDDDAPPVPAPTMFGVPLTEANGQQVLYTDLGNYVEVIKALADDGFQMVTDLTAVDYLEYRQRALPAAVVGERFEVVVHLRDLIGRRIIRVRLQVPAEQAIVPSLYDLYPGSEAMEREVYDMFGIEFEGHPDMTRILMPEDWDGHPLRKDYEVGRIPVQFKEANS